MRQKKTTDSQAPPVAKTYDELQSLPFIRSAVDTLPKNVETEKFLGGLVQAVYLLSKNVKSLADNAAAAADGRSWDRTALWTTWLVSIQHVQLFLVQNIIPETLLATNGGGDLHRAFQSAIEPGCSSIRAFDKHLLAQLQETNPSVVRSKLGTVEPSPLFRTLQNHKMAALMARTLADSDAYFFNTSTSFEGVLGRDFLDQAATAIAPPTGRTLFDTFRVLHQIPELLGLIALEAIQPILQSKEPDESSPRRLSIARKVMEIACVCVVPLARDLGIAQYHAIRDSLGKTSGSQSEALAKRLFKRDLLALGHIFATERPTNPSASFRASLLEFAAMRAAAIRWRAEHLHLPRNVLGGFGSTSLIGSPDAVIAVDTMVDLYKTSDPFVRDPSPSTLAQHVWEAEAEALKCTSKITVSRFPDVQARRRRFSEE